MQRPPPISTDGAYWWDGQAWQPMPFPGAVTAIEQSTTDTPRPSWLPEGAELPDPASPPGLQLIESPAAIGAPYAAISAPVWAPPTQRPSSRRSITRTVLLWVCLGLGGLVLLFGLLAIPVSLSGPSASRSDSVAGAVVFIILGGSIFVPCLAVLLGFGPMVSASFRELGILGCIVVLLTVVNTVVAVTRPVGGGRFVIPWATVVLVVFRAWRGHWLGAGILVGVWVVCSVIILTLAHP